VNRAPVLALWGAVVAERAGYRWDEALTLGQALAGLNARSKGKRLGIYEDAGKPEKRLPVHDGSAASARAKKVGAKFAVPMVGREVPAIRTEDGVRATVGGKPTNPETVEHYLSGKSATISHASARRWRSSPTHTGPTRRARTGSRSTNRSARTSPPARRAGARKACSI
jgi:hypothetical protein